jgi:translocation and assembly module TamB
VSASGLDLTAENVQIADLNELFSGTRKISGLLTATAHVEGTTAAPEVQSKLAITNGAVDTTAFQSLTGDFGYRDNRLTVNATLDAQPGAQLTAAGFWPVALGKAEGEAGNQPVDLQVKSTPIGLGLLQPLLTNHITSMTGTGQFNVHVTGTPRAPRVDGSVEVANAAFQVPPAGTSYAGGTARIRFDGERMLIDQFVIQDDDQHQLTIEGGAEVSNGRALRAVDLRIVTEDMHLLRNELGELTLDADLKTTGALSALEMTGEAKVERGRLEIDRLLEQFTTTAYSTKPHSAAEPGGSPEAAAPTDGVPAPAGAESPAAADGRETPADQVAEAVSGTPYDNATIKVRLEIPDDLVLRARNLRPTPESIGLGSTNLTLGGNLTLEKAPRGSLTVLGGVQVVRGFYDFQGRRFDIARGSELEFHGGQPINPALNVTATREISAVRTEVGLRGTAREPQIRLSSYPPLDESDILSLIVFGQPVNALGEAQRVNLAQRAGNLALGAIAGPLAESVGEALNLDLFEIRAEGEGGVPELALGSQVGEHVYIGLRQEFGREDVSVVTFEYRFSELLRLVTSVAQGVQQTHATRRNDPTGMDLMFVFRY